MTTDNKTALAKVHSEIGAIQLGITKGNIELFVEIAQLCEYQQQRIEQLETIEKILIEEVNKLAQYAPSNYQFSDEALTQS